MLMREKVLYPETVSDLKAALADCPDDLDIFDVFGETIMLKLETMHGEPAIVVG
jgi:hypothetical protein